jgi:hypothetical protein
MSLMAGIFKGISTKADSKLVYETNRAFPRHAFPDDDLDCWGLRMESLQQLLVERGRYSRARAENILVDPGAKRKEGAAAWLSTELEKLRKSERVIGSAPVLTGAALSRLTISDLAITMLQFLEEPPGTNLICLLQQLLDVDRHRARLAAKRGNVLTSVIEEARGRLVGRAYSVRQLAKLAAVDPSSISRWRRSASYQQMIDTQIESYQETLRFLIQEGEDRGLSRAKAAEQALAVQDARPTLKRYRAELAQRLSVAKSISDVRQIWERHVEHPMECGVVSSSSDDRFIALFLGRARELDPPAAER